MYAHRKTIILCITINEMYWEKMSIEEKHFTELDNIAIV